MRRAHAPQPWPPSALFLAESGLGGREELGAERDASPLTHAFTARDYPGHPSLAQAAAKAEQLTIAHPWLHGEGRDVGEFLELGATDCSTHVDATSPFRTPRFAGGLDVATAIRATEALATELVSDRVIERLMRTLLENAGNGTAGEISRAGIAES